MRAILLGVLATVLSATCALAAERCPIGGDKAFAELQAQLARAKTCQAAAARLHTCAWGSSADTSFAAPVVARCERDFLSRIPPADRRDYARQMQRCAYEYAGNQGTLFMSEAALCQVDVAAAFARDPKAALRPGRASFACADARTPLERLICADANLGQADIVLAGDYRDTLGGFAAADRGALVASERRWLADLPQRCGVEAQPTRTAVACVTRAYEARFAALNDCSTNSDAAACLAALEGSDTSAAPTAPRASFDCQSPRSALEIAVCADARLGQADIRLAAAFRAAQAAVGAGGGGVLLDSQRGWLRFVTASCPLGATGAIPPVQGRACVRSAYEVRTAQLARCAAGPIPALAACLADFRILPARRGTAQP